VYENGFLNLRRLKDGLGPRGFLHRLDLLFHGLESCREYGRGQLGNVLAIADSGRDPFLDQPLLQFHELCRAFHGGKRLHRSGQVLRVLGRQFLIGELDPGFRTIG
jgi:hypothetical protein